MSRPLVLHWNIGEVGLTTFAGRHKLSEKLRKRKLKEKLLKSNRKLLYWERHWWFKLACYLTLNNNSSDLLL